MRNFASVLAALYLLISPDVRAQSPNQVTFYNNGGSVYLAAGSVVSVSGGLTNDGASATIENHGSLTISSATNPGNIFLINASQTSGDGLYRIQQDWINDANFIAGASEVELYGDFEQFITSSNSTITIFNDLTLSGTGTGTDRRKTLQNVDSETGIGGVLDLGDRELATNQFDFHVRDNNANAITNSPLPGFEGFVSSDGPTGGRLSRDMLAGTSYLFPVGSSTGTLRYRPVELNPDANSVFAVRLANYSATADGYSLNNLPSTTCLLNDQFFHQIRQTVGAAQADITIHYDDIADQGWNGMAQWNTPVAAMWNDLGAENSNVGGGSSFVEKLTHGNFTDESFVLARTIPADPSIDGPDGFCTPAATLLNVVGAPLNEVYTWTVSNGTIIAGQGTSSVLIVWNSGPGSASVTATPPGGCVSATATHNLDALLKPEAGFSYTPGGVFGEQITFNDTSRYAATLNWTFGDGAGSSLNDPTHTFKAGTYTVQLIAANGEDCLDTAEAIITIEEIYAVPNVFTPNGDGINDWFYIPNTGIEGYSLQIFNRWGTPVWESTSSAIRWDGRTVAGIELPAGVYYFVLEGTTPVSGAALQPVSGSVMLIR